MGVVIAEEPRNLTRQELLDRTNVHFAIRGWRPVTDRQLSDWRDEDIVQGPVARGRERGRSPDWIWPDEAFEALKEIGRLRSLGATRVRQYRCYFWIVGRPIETARAREALRSEFLRMVTGERRRLGDTDTREKSSRTKARLRRAGYPDPDLPALPVDMDDQTQLAFLDGAITGEATRSRLEAFTLTLAKLAPEISGFVAGLPGLLGLTDETSASALASLDAASESELEQARAEAGSVMGKINWAIETGVFNAMSNRPGTLKEKLQSLDSATWAISIFMQSLNGRRRLQSENNRRQSR